MLHDARKCQEAAVFRRADAPSFIRDEIVKPPSKASGGALRRHLPGKLYEPSSVIIARNPSFAAWAEVFGNARMKTALRDRLRVATISFRRQMTVATSCSIPRRQGKKPPQ
ncbi:ATP-binding protein [Rhodosalinus sp. 5P4]|uniref:ATP-binding protein n=1 Tax=Rhodosalinus sp. 5P4 TaxID=3239196 RepID=UPI003524206C